MKAVVGDNRWGEIRTMKQTRNKEGTPGELKESNRPHKQCKNVP